MKSTIAIAAATVLFAATSSAAAQSESNIKFVAKNKNAESQVCVVAAKKGVKAARKTAKELGMNMANFVQDDLYCNGLNLRSFARRYNRTSNTAAEKTGIVASL